MVPDRGLPNRVGDHRPTVQDQCYITLPVIAQRRHEHANACFSRSHVFSTVETSSFCQRAISMDLSFSSHQSGIAFRSKLPISLNSLFIGEGCPGHRQIARRLRCQSLKFLRRQNVQRGKRPQTCKLSHDELESDDSISG